ncbi:MAG TPA: lipid-A-disaccharide synthase [Candidatus Limnocylindrales bacterium]|nr:lipid-A-disaccharide synthase [Candidatus Limnocylindrales bacterium]
MSRRILMVAGEASGDALGARLAAALLECDPALHLFGVGGPRMRGAGVEILTDISELGVMGFAELGRGLGRAIGLLRRLRRELRSGAADLFVPIDFPDFNLPLCRTARRAGVKVAYYVSPQVWAWRRGRIATIAATVDRMIVLFPFEEQLYRKAGIDAHFVGHPLAEDVTARADPATTRRRYGLTGDAPLLALLPGSRRREVDIMLPPMLEAARALSARVQCAAAEAVSLPPGFLASRLGSGGRRIAVVRDDTYDLLAASDVALVTSGTATLETALLGCPMVVAYRMSAFTYAIARRLVKVPHIAMPNLLLGRTVVPELIQDEVTGPRMTQEVARYLDEPDYRARTVAALGKVRGSLRRPGSVRAAARLVLETLA